MKAAISGMVLFFCALFPLGAWAQQTGPLPQPSTSGFTGYETFQGSVDSFGSLLKLDSTFGYDFNRHIGVFAGVPLYFAHDFDRATATSRLTNSGAGDFYFGVDAFAPGRWVDYSTSLTISAPTGNVNKGFSAGHRTIDWTSRFRRPIGQFKPFIAAGLSNTVPDTDLVTRTFSSLGNVVHLEEGADYGLKPNVYVGASAYHTIPFGSQTTFSRLAGNDGLRTASSGSRATRENGFDAWIGFEPSRITRLELGYSRSITFAENRLSFNVGVNVGRLLRRSR